MTELAPAAREGATTSEHGVLGGPALDFGLERVPAGPGVASLVERHWLVSWSLPPGRSNTVTLLPHPCVNLVLDAGALTVCGVGHRRFSYRHEGRGQVFGVKFRPGAFLPFLGRPLVEITDAVLPAEQLWGPAATRLAAALSAAPDVAERVELAEGFLRRRWPEPDPQVWLVGRLVAAMLHDRTITRVADVSDRFGLGPRSLQRLFRRYVGVSPRWVLRRYRLHEAAAALARERHRPWAEVAAELGYFDQSHFVRDFTAAVGLTPAAYADACQRGQAPVRA